MADKIVEVPGIGRIAFPDSMSDDDIGAAIKKQLPPDPRSASQVATDQIKAIAESSGLAGLGRLITHPVDTISSAASSAAADPTGTIGNVIKSAAMIPVNGAIGGTRALVTSGRNLGALIAPNSVQAATPEENAAAATGAGQFAAAVPAIAGIGEAGAKIASGLKSGALSEGLMMRAANNRAMATSASAPAATTQMAILNAVKKAYPALAAPVQEKLALALASKGAITAEASTIPVSALIADQRPEEILSPRLHKPESDNIPPPTPPLNQGVDAANPTAEKINPVRPESPYNPEETRVAAAGEYADNPLSDLRAPASPSVPLEMADKPNFDAIPDKAPAVLDGPTVNKWLGVRPRDVLYGADPGQRLIDENLIGANKVETAANIDRALPSASADLKGALAKADASGKTVNAETVFNDAVANAVKKAGIRTDEAFMKGIEQLQTDAEAQFGDLSKLPPSQAHKLKVWIQQSTDFGSNPATQNVSNNFFKTVGGGINTALKAVDPDIAPAMARWGDLKIAAKSLKQSIANNVVGRGTPSAMPTQIIEGLKK